MDTTAAAYHGFVRARYIWRPRKPAVRIPAVFQIVIHNYYTCYCILSLDLYI